MTGRYKSRADFEQSDARQFLPRFSDANFPANLQIVDKFKSIADKYNVTTGQLTLAWILARHPEFVPIPGTKRVSRLEENAKSVSIKLSAVDLKALNEVVEAADVKGGRYPAEMAYLMNQDCIPLGDWKEEAYL